MMDAAVRILTIAALCCGGFLGGAAFAQDAEQRGAAGGGGAPAAASSGVPAAASSSGPSAASSSEPSAASDRSPPAAVNDQVIVRGRSRAELRAEILKAEDAFFDRFNEINGNDDFDIHCRDEVPINSHIPRHKCEANFWRKTESDAGQALLRQIRGEAAPDPQAFFGEGYYKDGLMAKEMRRLVAEDPELRAALVRFGTLKEAEQGGRPEPARTKTVSSETTADEKPLPYDAKVEADVRIGREPWSHALTQRTFAIADLSGEIRAMEVKCRGRRERLRYNADAEWNVPADWAPCTLSVKASPGTTFSLFEFK
ncbi:MAG TPA: hypothetical protein VFV10_20835 [Gammaproteobacteria bacterium]|nr:hypothetical protein [Gammaproteobacteria bacterium]